MHTIKWQTNVIKSFINKSSNCNCLNLWYLWQFNYKKYATFETLTNNNNNINVQYEATAQLKKIIPQLKIQSRCIFINSVLYKNHYKSLGVNRNATQSDIKTAYYNLSMVYHPDKNKGSEDAANRFRDITEAYEVLGNFRLRKLYDKGMIQSAMPHHSPSAESSPDHPIDESIEEDDAQTKFYKQYRKRTERPHASGRTPIYDFDEWTRQHYGTNFQRKQSAKAKFAASEQSKVSDRTESKKEYLFGFIAVLMLIFCFLTIDLQRYAIDRTDNKNPSESNKK